MLPFIVLAGGSGKRFSKKLPKQYHFLCTKPIIYYTFNSLLESNVDKCILVIDYAYKELVKNIIKPFIKKINIKFAPKGNERKDSVQNALKVLDKKYKWVAIHDSVRPFFTKKLLNLLIKNKKGVEGVVPGLPIFDTIKKIKKNNIVYNTINRKMYNKIGTPQIINRIFYEKAIKNIKKINIKNITDDASIIELAKGKIRVVEGENNNIKITTKIDLSISEIILRRYYANRNRV